MLVLLRFLCIAFIEKIQIGGTDLMFNQEWVAITKYFKVVYMYD